jgi:MoxR-like ATPase
MTQAATGGRIFLGNNEPHDDWHLPSPPPWRDFHRAARELKGRTYQASEKEIELVNAALYLRRPLLVTGRPGVGKTSLAHAVAWELDLGEVLIWPINTRSTLQQGLYDYDAIARVRDASIEARQGDDADVGGPPDIGRYLRLGPLGTALIGGPSGRPRVLLIDEIDKSDIDLPNDLLNTFEEGEFEIRELSRMRVPQETEIATFDGARTRIIGGRMPCKTFPIVILTSNGEREFPPAFLRRCLRLDIDLPTEGELQRIIERHLGGASDSGHSAEVQRMMREFLDRRDKEGKILATDQLLNAVFMVMHGIDPANRPALKEALLRALGESG